ncbi:unnamed protein product [Thelazia callipaeda]|uniref:Two pore potassium channel protein sup-9 n=1 Tax=Thelazia callipaeda TaxID=103827 RepID=A0A0N5CT35_THECL|nr:unnamed protein product [Thelazia callipaeda]
MPDSSQKSIQMQRKNIRAILLIISTFTYLLIGAAVFEKLEYRSDLERRHGIDMIAQKLHNKYNFSEKDYQVLQAVVIKSISHKAGLQWGFAGAFFFAVVVITTLGYGHSTPNTTLGKLFCMIFALAGIPLGLIMFQSIGERVNTAIAYVLRKIRSCLNSRGYNVLREVTPKHLLFVSFSIGTMVITIDKIFFLLLSTIGFGDYVPLQTDGIMNNRPGYFAFTLLFIVGGLALFSASVNLLVLG